MVKSDIMKKLSIILILIFSCSVAWGGDCPYCGIAVPHVHPESPIGIPESLFEGKVIEVFNIKDLQKEIELLKEKIKELEDKKSYTVREIDELREVCEDIWLYGTVQGSGMSRAYHQSDKDRGVEALVRTYMEAGITAEDIYKEDNK